MQLRQDTVPELLDFYMGKNTPQRQEFIIDNLKIEDDRVEELEKEAKHVIANNRDAA